MFNNFISPNNKNKLVLRNNKFYDGELEFDIFEGIPNFIFPKNLSKQDFEAKNFYEGRAAAYEQYLHLTFETYGENWSQISSRDFNSQILTVTLNYKFGKIEDKSRYNSRGNNEQNRNDFEIF